MMLVKVPARHKLPPRGNGVNKSCPRHSGISHPSWLTVRKHTACVVCHCFGCVAFREEALGWMSCCTAVSYSPDCDVSEMHLESKKPHLAFLDLACEGFEDLPGRHRSGALQIGVHPRICLVLEVIGRLSTKSRILPWQPS